jgi:hypothetical protein
VASDEEGQVAAPATEKRWGNRAVELDRVELLDALGTPVRAVRSGEAAGLRMVFSVREPQADYVFGFALHREDGVHVFGTNTTLDGWEALAPLDGDGQVTLELPSLELAPGRYLVDAAVHTRAGLAFDYWREALSFLVTAPVAWPGSYAPRHRWGRPGPLPADGG